MDVYIKRDGRIEVRPHIKIQGRDFVEVLQPPSHWLDPSCETKELRLPRVRWFKVGERHGVQVFVEDSP